MCDEFGSVPAVFAMMVSTALGSSSSKPKYCTTFAGTMLFCGLDQLRQVQARGVGGHFAHLRGIAEQVLDLVMENQRQTGQRQQQQKHGADQAGPGVDERPAANCFTSFHFMTFKNTEAVHGDGLVTGPFQLKRLPLVGGAGNDAALVAVVAIEAVAGGDVVLVGNSWVALTATDAPLRLLSRRPRS